MWLPVTFAPTNEIELFAVSRPTAPGGGMKPGIELGLTSLPRVFPTSPSDEATDGPPWSVPMDSDGPPVPPPGIVPIGLVITPRPGRSIVPLAPAWPEAGGSCRVPIAPEGIMGICLCGGASLTTALEVGGSLVPLWHAASDEQNRAATKVEARTIVIAASFRNVPTAAA